MDWQKKCSVNVWYKISQYFRKLYERFEVNVKVKLDLRNYETTADLKEAIGIDTSNLATKAIYWPSLKTEVDKRDMDKIKTVPANVVDKDVV